MTEQEPQQSNKRLIIKLVVLVIGMFGFGFALVPLYSVVCKVTGLNGKTQNIDDAAAQAMAVDTSRWVTVEFTTTVNEGMPWEFRPQINKMRVHPGEVATATFYARNLTDAPMVGQAVPSLSPRVAAQYFKKIECFCFTRQTLNPKEAKEMPLRYVVEPDLPREVKTITLAYTFFDTDTQAARSRSTDRATDLLAGRHEDHANAGSPGG
jgi:cytochrome c oxidase assembly protein subunit 11